MAGEALQHHNPHPGEVQHPPTLSGGEIPSTGFEGSPYGPANARRRLVMAWGQEEPARPRDTGTVCPGSRSRGWRWKARAAPPPRRGMRCLCPGPTGGDGLGRRWKGTTFPEGFLFPASWFSQRIKSQGSVNSIAGLSSRAEGCLGQAGWGVEPGSQRPQASGSRQQDAARGVAGRVGQARGMKVGGSMCRTQPTGSRLLVFEELLL